MFYQRLSVRQVLFWQVVFAKCHLTTVAPTASCALGSIRLEKNRMNREVIYTDKAPHSPIYSQAIKAAGLIFIAGQGPFHPVTGEICGETIQEQTRQCLTNVSSILSAAGSSMSKVVSATFVLAEESDFPGMNEEWSNWFPVNPPARQGAKLPSVLRE